MSFKSKNFCTRLLQLVFEIVIFQFQKNNTGCKGLVTLRLKDEKSL